uniref:ORF34 n=1 Tax=Equid alphaherpesvirus 1 TaxID=10326 RepID=A0A2P0MXW6_9ALPH|nr:ORF34 [Equid alphaherpesvirus 1]
MDSPRGISTATGDAHAEAAVSPAAEIQIKTEAPDVDGPEATTECLDHTYTQQTSGGDGLDAIDTDDLLEMVLTSENTERTRYSVCPAGKLHLLSRRQLSRLPGAAIPSICDRVFEGPPRFYGA